MIMNRGQEIELAANAAIDGLSGLEGFDETDMYNMFASGVTWADAHPKNPWISVKDRLPEPEQEVLLYDVDSVKHYAIGWLRKKKGYCKSKWFVINGYVTDDSITHWMSIVEPK
ncbi:DUF551 domain-containing protein [Bacteroides fragilis]|uniref:DUF551 domain-containing protein n=1 Tax=Bacteroides fragilis TaxID=817 RepID=UPI001C6FE691|nr:DUF551 domain-containing protein [Bacteroides fragilis]MBW9277447.1 DUF551 domain-containing protein [Bacteroides fragilis]